MKYPIKHHLLVLAVLLLAASHVKSQEKVNSLSSSDIILKKQADSLKANFSKEGFVIMKEAKMTMESDFEIPVIVPLKEGSSYEFAFIGDPSSGVCEIRMYDENEKQVVFLKQDGIGTDRNIISYSYVPAFTAYHIIKPVQVNKKKKKNISGYIMMFKKVT
jgi:hypothetical protein